MSILVNEFLISSRLLFPRNGIVCDVMLTFVVRSLSLSLSLSLANTNNQPGIRGALPDLAERVPRPAVRFILATLRIHQRKNRGGFEQILKEESLEIKLKAIDDACVARGIDMNARVNSIEAIAEDMVSKVVAPEEAARAARADAKRRELILLEEECEKERVVEEEHVRILEEKRREVQMAAGRVGRAQNELEEVRDASLQWAGRQAYVSR